MQNDTPQTTLVLGGGPAGLTAGYLLRKTGREVVVFEAEDQVGGLAKTVEIDASHLALISQPGAITNLIMEALAV